MLRAFHLGISFRDLFDLEIGEVFDMMTESLNDNADYPKLAEQNDFDNFLK